MKKWPFGLFRAVLGNILLTRGAQVGAPQAPAADVGWDAWERAAMPQSDGKGPQKGGVSNSGRIILC